MLLKNTRQFDFKILIIIIKQLLENIILKKKIITLDLSGLNKIKVV